MNPIEPRAQATLDAAINLIRTAAASAAIRVADNLTVAAQNATKISERDQLATTQQELRRNLGSFQNAFYESLREKVAKDIAPRVDQKRKLESADWQTLSLVDEREVEEQMNFVRLGQMISHECEWQLRELSPTLTPWLAKGVGALAVSLLLWGVFLVPDQFRLKRIPKDDRRTLRRIFLRWTIVGWITTLVLFFGLWAMVTKH